MPIPLLSALMRIHDTEVSSSHVTTQRQDKTEAIYFWMNGSIVMVGDWVAACSERCGVAQRDSGIVIGERGGGRDLTLELDVGFCFAKLVLGALFTQNRGG